MVVGVRVVLERDVCVCKVYLWVGRRGESWSVVKNIGGPSFTSLDHQLPCQHKERCCSTTKQRQKQLTSMSKVTRCIKSILCAPAKLPADGRVTEARLRNGERNGGCAGLLCWRKHQRQRRRPPAFEQSKGVLYQYSTPASVPSKHLTIGHNPEIGWYEPGRLGFSCG